MTGKTNTAPQDLLKKDFYEYVNYDWLKTAEIPADKPATGSFNELSVGIENLLMKEVKDMAQDIASAPSELMKEFLKYYQLATDFDAREATGTAPLLPLLNKIDSLQSFADLNAQFPEWTFTGMALPVYLEVDADMKNATTNALIASPPSLFLPDKTYYEAGHENGAQLMNVFFEMMVKLFKMLGKNDKEAESIAEQAIAFDKLIAPHVKSAEESADYSKMYNPQTFEEFVAHSTELDLGNLIQGLVGAKPDQVIVTDPTYFEQLNQLLTQDHFALMKSWLSVITVLTYDSYLTEEFRQTGGLYGRTLSGVAEEMPQEKAAYYLAKGRFSQVVGLYYGKKYFGEKAKNDVHQMVENMIAVYKSRLQTNTWLSEATRKKAIVKLDALGIQVGYPDEIPAIYQQFKTVSAEDGGTLFNNTLRFREITSRDHYSQWNKPVRRNEWELSADTVNAYYHPFRNVIVFPAAILQAPFYSLDQSSSANYGGIGAVIAHEISHAFDNNGALFDEFGNLNNWWTEEDLAHFQALAQQVIEQFDGIPFAGLTVNGKLTVSENIADAGGLSCALEATKQEEDADLPAFFMNWATIWRTNAKTEYQQLLLSVDVHGPAKLRANVQPQNLADFYSTFDIQPEDDMYLAPEKRITIW
ncbi:peptidase M13 [Enterococcus sp. JM4C]|uniref:M13 family metallopeptidase n=1 Tax=Candidatus Enterococcus huntleyi TaxID=1857217 RepID=UPI0013797202|nr:M13-type metalloendopeptidase [Enterococcus sp. JM4C]KAF1295594.1 peptidase M13 [Enterococcus sp. JM4C]